MVTVTVPLVDVVVDVQSAGLDQPFTYAVGDHATPPLGARVSVPLGRRVVRGWVVGAGQRSGPGEDFKSILGVEEADAIPQPALELARWMRRRYACTFREALTAVARRVAGPAERFRFERPPAGDDTVGRLLHARYGVTPFSALGAERALRCGRRPVPLRELRRKLAELVRAGSLTRSERVAPQHRSSGDGMLLASLADATAARGPAQRRLAAILADAGGELPLKEARARSGASAAVVRSAVKAGAIGLRAGAARPAQACDAARQPLELTPQQQEAVSALDSRMTVGPTTALLHGVTGSGKTLVYIRLIDRVRARGGRAIVLVPEIALTPQTAARLQAEFGVGVGVLHSGLSAAQRAHVWSSAASGALDVVIGARSAVFAPMPDLRLIIIDEEHEPSYKQDVAPRYDAAAVAMERMRATGGSVVLGSATPSLETYREALEGRIMHVRLSQRATKAPLPPVEVVDMRRTTRAHPQGALGPALTAAIESCLAEGQKSLLFVNRRGYAALLLCRSCGFAPRCRRCAVSLVVHAADRSMRCHVCGDAFRIAAACPRCGSDDLAPYGLGTQRLEEEVRELFPGARVVRMDADSTTAIGAHERLLTSFAADGDILIGTQMIAKGLDFPTVTLVGVVAADMDLNRPDFRAAERTFQLLTQVAGRAGRAAAGSRVIVQTYAPDHDAIALAARHDYDTFATRELELRRELGYPPYGRLSHVVVAGIDRARVMEAAAALAALVRERGPQLEVLGPAPDVLPKARGEFRMRIAVKSGSEDAMLEACGWARSHKLGADVRTTIIVDPR